MFEKYNFAGVFIQIQAVLTLYAQGAYGDYWRFIFSFVCLYSSQSPVEKHYAHLFDIFLPVLNSWFQVC